MDVECAELDARSRDHPHQPRRAEAHGHHHDGHRPHRARRDRPPAARDQRRLRFAVLNLRQVVRAVAGGDFGPEGSVTKMLIAEHTQHVGELAMHIAGPAAFLGDEPVWTHYYLLGRAMTIAGGTSEINRNVIAERLLGPLRGHISN
ncbi:MULTISPECIES: acyl-CoA dehydrogenase family protein [Rhodococcus]|uniref:acyl-CoA dehydrogenase family protein n=1 Tax=Rhodococcus TaxID=1827 RepID=UPI003B014F32